MKNLPSIFNFFKNNTPKYAQIIGDISLILAGLGAIIIALPQTFASCGINDFVVPAFLLTIAKYMMAAGSVIKIITKLFGQIETVVKPNV